MTLYYHYTMTRIQQCKMEVDHTIFYCSMHLHISRKWSQSIFAEHLSNIVCQRLHRTGTLSVGWSAIISGPLPNSMITSNITLAGSSTTDGHCSKTQYSDPYRTWDTMIVQTIIKIVLKDFEVPIERISSQLILLSRQRCDARRGECLDSENG